MTLESIDDEVSIVEDEEIIVEDEEIIMHDNNYEIDKSQFNLSNQVLYYFGGSCNLCKKICNEIDGWKCSLCNKIWCNLHCNSKEYKCSCLL